MFCQFIEIEVPSLKIYHIIEFVAILFHSLTKNSRVKSTKRTNQIINANMKIISQSEKTKWIPIDFQNFKSQNNKIMVAVY